MAEWDVGGSPPRDIYIVDTCVIYFYILVHRHGCCNNVQTQIMHFEEHHFSVVVQLVGLSMYLSSQIGW